MKPSISEPGRVEVAALAIPMATSGARRRHTALPPKTDNDSMSSSSYPVLGIADQLLFAGHVLRALESGQMRMNAGDHLEISDWASRELERLDTAVLQRLRRRVAPALQCIVENLLHARHEAIWCADDMTHRTAQSVWQGLNARL